MSSASVSSQKGINPFDQLPEKVFCHILQFLIPKESQLCSSLSKQFFRGINQCHLQNFGREMLQRSSVLISGIQNKEQKDRARFGFMSACTDLGFLDHAVINACSIKDWNRFTLDPLNHLIQKIMERRLPSLEILSTVVGKERIVLLKLKAKLNQEPAYRPLDFEKMIGDIFEAIVSFDNSDLSANDEEKTIANVILVDLIHVLIQANHLEKLEEIASKIEQEAHQYRILPSIAAAYWHAGQKEKAEKLFKMLEDHVNTDKSLENVDDVLILIALAKAKASIGLHEDADYLFRRAEKMVSHMGGVVSIEHYSTKIADARVKCSNSKDPEPILQIYENKFICVDQQASLYVVRKLAENGFFKEALEVIGSKLKGNEAILGKIYVAAHMVKSSPEKAFEILQEVTKVNKNLGHEVLLKIALASHGVLQK